MFRGFWFASHLIFGEWLRLLQNSLPRAVGVLADEGLVNWACNEVHENSGLCFLLGDFYCSSHRSHSGGLAGVLR